MVKWVGLSLLITAGLFAFPAQSSLVELPSPAATGSEAPNLSVAPDGRVLLSWLEPTSAKTYALKYSLRERQGWSTPRIVTSSDDWFVSGADYPTVAFMADGTMAANSLIATNLRLEAYNTNVFLSSDAGKTWSKPVQLHRDKKIRQHGFVSFVPAPEGRLGAVWLDGRNLSKENMGDMSLLYATIGKDGSIRGETTLDSRVCECCQTSATSTPDGLLVAYRDRSAKEVRDISIVRFANGKWSAPVTVSNDNWTVDACPINGPAIAATGRNVAVAWYSEAGDKPRVNVAFSNDGGTTFGKPIRIDEGNPMGGIDLATLTNGGAIVSWVERNNQKSEVRFRRVGANGTTEAATLVSGAGSVPLFSVPRIERSGNELFITWTVSGERPSVRTAVVNLQ